MELPKISIVIPSCNKVSYIEETLKSIVAQEYPNLEVIIQDGGSTDGTLEIIKRYVKRYPQIFSYTSKKDKGQTEAINSGLKKAKGEVFAYINADDLYERGALREVGEYFAQHPSTPWLAGRGKVIDAKGNEIAKIASWYKDLLLAFNRYSLLLMVNYLMQPSVFVSKRTYQKYGPFTGWEKGILEYDLWLKLGVHKMPVVIRTNISLFRLAEGVKSMVYTDEVLKHDLSLVEKYTDNVFLVELHALHNNFRKILGNILRL